MRILKALLLLVAGAPALGGQSPSSSGPTVTLQEAIEEAVLRNPNAVAASGAVRTAEADRFEVRGGWFPTLALNSSFTNSSNQRFDQATGQLVSQSYSAQAQVGYDLFTGGRRWAQTRSAGERLRAADAGYREQIFQTALTTTEIYYSAAAADELVASARQRLARAEAQLSFARTRMEVGTATRSDELRAELELGNAELSLVEAESLRRTYGLQLARQMGREGEVQAVPGALIEEAPELPSLERLLLRARDGAPAVRTAEAERRSRSALTWVSWSTYIPTLRVTGGYDWFSFDFPPQDRSWNVRLVASVPVFNGLQREASIVRARVQEELAVARLRDAQLGVQVAVEDAYRAIESADRRVAIARRGVALAGEDLRVQEERYQFGTATILELQTSQVAVSDAETVLVRERQSLGVAVARLEAILGESLNGDTR